MPNKFAMVASLIAALVGGTAAHFYLERLEQQALGGEPQQILIATRDVAAGAVLTEELLATRDLPKAFLEQRHVLAADAKKILGVRIGVGLKANESISWSDLNRGDGTARELADLVQAGMRALVLDTHSADFSGLLRPGNRVDLLFSDTQGGPDSGTSLLLQNLLVLAVGASVGVEAERAAGATGSVTLSLSVEQTQIVTEARRRGRLSLTLRNSDDIVVVQRLPATKATDIVGWRERGVALAEPRKTEIEHVR